MTIGDRIVEALRQRAVMGINAVGAFATDRAKYHAPVRHIFDGNKIRNPRGKPFRGSVRNWTAGDYEMFRKSKRRTRQIITQEGPVEGTIASFRPVFRKQGTLLTGDFRRYDHIERTLDTAVPVLLQRQGSLDLERHRQGTKSGARQLNINNFLSSRGRYEVANATGRGRFFTGLYTSYVGGRLRGEIYQKPARYARRDGMFWTYVISPTPYAIHQEYGTRHHRAQPFLRPALYESRAQLRREFSKHNRPLLAKALMFGRVGAHR